jgi:hypothetical protein
MVTNDDGPVKGTDVGCCCVAFSFDLFAFDSCLAVLSEQFTSGCALVPSILNG